MHKGPPIPRMIWTPSSVILLVPLRHTKASALVCGNFLCEVRLCLHIVVRLCKLSLPVSVCARVNCMWQMAQLATVLAKKLLPNRTFRRVRAQLIGLTFEGQMQLFQSTVEQLLHFPSTLHVIVRALWAYPVTCMYLLHKMDDLNSFKQLSGNDYDAAMKEPVRPLLWLSQDRQNCF